MKPRIWRALTDVGWSSKCSRSKDFVAAEAVALMASISFALFAVYGWLLIGAMLALQHMIPQTEQVAGVTHSSPIYELGAEN